MEFRGRQVKPGRADAASRAAPVAVLRPGDLAQLRALTMTPHRATAAEGGPIVPQLVEATRRLVAVLTELCDRVGAQEPSQPDSRERAARFAGQLHGMVGAVRDALSRVPANRRRAARSRSRATGPTAAVHALDAPSEGRPHPADRAASCAPVAGPTLRAFVLGRFEVQLNGEPIDGWPHCRSKAIFKYLLLNRRQPVARELLMERFWPDAEPEAARNSLNVAVHRLRRALEREDLPIVLFSGGRYLLNPALSVSTDADTFLAHAARAGELERAQDLDGATREYQACVSLYQGELLAEDRHAHDEWLAPLRQQLRDRHLHALERLGSIHFGRQEVPACMAACARMLAVDPCNEGAHRLLMRCYGRLGQPQLAQQQYQTCIQALNRQLGVPASSETTELYRHIVRGQTA